jgi:hypothetical protein
VALGRLAGFAAAGTALAGLAATTGLGLPCPWRGLTGTLCPLCGATHLGVRLLQLDPVGAFAANQFVFVGLVVLAVLGGAWSVEALGGPKLRPPRPLRVGADRWYLAIAVIGVGFAVLRNLQ